MRSSHFLCGISFSLALFLPLSFAHWPISFSALHLVRLMSRHEALKKTRCKSWGCVSCTCTHSHTRIHTSSKAIATSVCYDLRSWVRSVRNNLSRFRQSWWSCDICEHCVPVNAITHYPLSLPAQAEWLHFSLSHPVSLSVSPSLSSPSQLHCCFFSNFQCNIL